ncbi:MAG: DUF4178 domain-containing protein [Elusimicrobia bacterium]|nr:DUF4178 domain-containing protein [Elusimicrobiota bacterium]
MNALRCPKCSCPLDVVPLPEGVSVESCPHCFGAFYDAAELAVKVELSGAVDTEWNCPKCGGRLQTGRAYGKLELERCAGCKGIWFDSGEIGKLREHSGVEGLIKPGAGPAPGDPPLMPAAALAAFTQKLEEQRAGAAKGKTPKALEEKDSPFPEIPEGSTLLNLDEKNDPRVEHQGRTYRHFQTSRPVVTYVVGEFPWKVKVGETAIARDFVCPPHLLSQEKNGKESVWTQGEYVEPSEIWTAFKLAGSPPTRVGVAPAQPNPYEASWKAVALSFAVFAVAAVCAASVIGGWSAGKLVYNKQLQFDPKAAEKSTVTEVFELEGHTSNVEVFIDAQLNNQWAFFSMALINADTDVALDFSREVAFYTGVDEDGQWREGSPLDTVYLPMVPPGRYYLRIEPETDTGAFSYNLRVRRDVARFVWMWLALILLALPMFWVLWRRSVFEQMRWMESDHPWASGSDDDDE